MSLGPVGDSAVLTYLAFFAVNTSFSLCQIVYRRIAIHCTDLMGLLFVLHRCRPCALGVFGRTRL